MHGQWELMLQQMKEIFIFVCAHMSFMWTYRVCFYAQMYYPYRFLWVLCPELRLRIHVALQPTLIYVEAVTSRINPLFLTTSVVSAPFPFYKRHNLSFEVLVGLPRSLPLCVQLLLTACVLIMHSIAFALLFSPQNCSIWMKLCTLNLEDFHAVLYVEARHEVQLRTFYSVMHLYKWVLMGDNRHH